MDSTRLYRSLFLIDDTRNYTNEFYVSEFAKIVLFREGAVAITLVDLQEKIEELTSLEYTEEDIVHAISIWNNNEIEVEDGYYSLSSAGIERISKRKKSYDINTYIDLFLRTFPDKYSITKTEFETLLEKFIYQRFNENLKEISDILNHCLDIDDCDKKYDENEKNIINDFLEWDNVEKNQCVFCLIAKAYDYCMINSKCQAQEVDFSKISFYLDTNIIFRLMGINGSERESSVKSLIDKCRLVGIKLIVSNYVKEECEYTINSQLQVLVDSTTTMNKLMPPSVMSFAEEKSIKLDFYRRYYDWVKSGNKHRNYDGFKKSILREFNELVQSFESDDSNISFKAVSMIEFNGYYDSLYNSKMDKQTTETDINSFMLILKKRKLEDDGNEYFLISADQRLVSWTREIFPGQKSVADFPSAWLSIILKYTGREKESDYKAFCQFIHLSIEPQIDDLEKKIAIKSEIMSTDIDDDIKTIMIEEVRDNYNQYKDYSPEKVIHVSYAKTKENIETDVKRVKDIEFDEKLETVQKDFEEQLNQQKGRLDSLILESETAKIDAYNRGRRDGVKEQRDAEIETKVNKTFKRNKSIRNAVKVVVSIFTIAVIVAWILLGVFGFLDSGTKIERFFDEKGLFVSGLGTLLDVFFIVFSIDFIQEKILPIETEKIREKVRK